MKKQQNTIFLHVLIFFVITITSVYAQDQSQFGFVGDREQTFVAASPESIAIWKQWCALHEKGDVEGITALAAENIRIEAPGGELTIDGKEALTAFLTQWFDDNEQVRVTPEWGVPLKFINQEGNPIDGDWVTSSFSLQINDGTETTVEQNHAMSILKMGKFNISESFNTAWILLPRLPFPLIFHLTTENSQPLAFLDLSTTGVALAIP